MSRYVIVSGIPAAGKSTVAVGLAQQSSLPLFDKDRFLEALFSEQTPRDPLERRSLSARADIELRGAVRASPEAIVVSWWRHPRSLADSGTPTEWLRELPGALVEVHCQCAPQSAVERFRRRARHPGHLDARWSKENLLAQLAEVAQFGPLDIGVVVNVDTEKRIDFEVLWGHVQRASQGLTSSCSGP